MRPLPPAPPGKHHGVVHSTRITKEQAEELAKTLKIDVNKKKWLVEGTEIHIVREAKESELAKKK